jgi:hypothetical protein
VVLVAPVSKTAPAEVSSCLAFVYSKDSCSTSKRGEGSTFVVVAELVLASRSLRATVAVVRKMEDML